MSESFNDYNIYLPAGAAGEVDTLCPECSHTRKKNTDRCLSVNTMDGTWVCHHCDWAGSLKRDKGWAAPKYNAAHAKKYVKPEFEPDIDLSTEAIGWFAKRGICLDTLRKENVVSDKGWIRFPYYKNGDVVNIKSRKLGEKRFHQSKGAEKILYGIDVEVDLDGADKPPPLIWVEGEIDRLSLLEAGYKYVVSVPDGAPNPGSRNMQAKFSYLANCEEFIRLFDQHIIAVDSDEPGQFLQNELARRLGLEKCKRVTWPTDCKDANEVLVKHGWKVLDAHIADAMFFPVEGIFEVKDILPDAITLYQDGVTRGWDTGHASVDRYLSIRPGELCILTGIPSSGKSAWVDDLMVNLAINHEVRCGIFSPENAPLSQHFKKLSEIYVGKSFFEDTKKGTERMTPNEMLDAARFLHEHMYFINPHEDMFTIDEILAKAKVLVFRHGIQFLVIDPYNDIDQSSGTEVGESRQASILLAKCQRFARMYNVFVCLVAHPTKLRKDEKTGDYPCPTPYDISGSAHFRNRADICLAGHRPDLLMDIMELHIQKVRFKEVGRLGMARLDYCQHNGRFYDHIGSFTQTRQARAMASKSIQAELQAARAAHEENGTPTD